jgi:hypothetical protein
VYLAGVRIPDEDVRELVRLVDELTLDAQLAQRRAGTHGRSAAGLT